MIPAFFYKSLPATTAPFHHTKYLPRILVHAGVLTDESTISLDSEMRQQKKHSTHAQCMSNGFLTRSVTGNVSLALQFYSSSCPT